MRYYTALALRCDARVPGPDKKMTDCRHEALFENTEGHAPFVLEGMARKAGWYVALSGRDLCPVHHRQEAAKYGWASLYEPPEPRGVPIAPPQPSKSN